LGGASETARDVAASILNIDTGKPTMLLATHGHEKYVQYPQEKQQGELTMMHNEDDVRTMKVHNQMTPPLAKANSTTSTALTVYRSQDPTTVTLYTNPMKEWVNLEVYVDDYIAMEQLLAALPYLTRAMLHGL
jgi:hypothetical protein